jgi:hypothetical protein
MPKRPIFHLEVRQTMNVSESSDCVNLVCLFVGVYVCVCVCVGWLVVVSGVIFVAHCARARSVDGAAPNFGASQNTYDQVDTPLEPSL